MNVLGLVRITAVVAAVAVGTAACSSSPESEPAEEKHRAAVDQQPAFDPRRPRPARPRSRPRARPSSTRSSSTRPGRTTYRGRAGSSSRVRTSTTRTRPSRARTSSRPARGTSSSSTSRSRTARDVNDKDSFDGTALIRAAERGHADVVGRLVQAGIDLDHVNNLGWTALHEAVVLGEGTETYVDTVRVLVAAGVDVTVPRCATASPPLRARRTAGPGGGRRDPHKGPRTPAKTDLLEAAADGDADGVATSLRQAPTSRSATSTSGRRSCWPAPTTASRRPACSSPSAPTRTPSTTGTTPPGW